MITLQKLNNLKGRRALITGATGGLGKSIASSLAELGADLILVDREGSNFLDLIESLTKLWNVKIEFYCCDLEEETQRTELITKLNADKKGLSILINNAAFVGSSELLGWAVPFEQQTNNAWRRALEVNLVAIFHLCQGLADLLKNSGHGSIVNIASIYAEYAPDWSLYEGTNMSNPAAYAASKSGLIQLTRWLATTISPYVRVNAISPGGIYRNQPQEFVRKYIAKTPLRRMANEDDICGAVAYLASDLSSYVTGQNLFVDGGWGIW